MWLRPYFPPSLYRVDNILSLPPGLPASASAQTPFPEAVPEMDAPADLNLVPAELNMEFVFHLGKITVSMNSFFCAGDN
jgi:hypothetical protein